MSPLNVHEPVLLNEVEFASTRTAIVFVATCLALLSGIASAQPPASVAMQPVSSNARANPADCKFAWRFPATSPIQQVGMWSRSQPNRSLPFLTQTSGRAEFKLIAQADTAPNGTALGSGESDAEPAVPAESVDAPNPVPVLLDPPLQSLTVNIAPTAGDLPPNAAPRRPAQPAPASRGWANSLYQWQAPVLCHKRLYFEEVNLERYGYRTLGPLQPVLSGAHFFGAVLALPYNLTAANPCECVYTLGHYRPGSEVPRQIYWPKRSAIGAGGELGTIAGLILLVP